MPDLIGIASPFLFARRWSPSMLFGASKLGLLLSAARFDTLFQDAAGTIRVNAPGQPVGLIRDLSGRGNHASQAVALSRPILARHPSSGFRQLLSNSTDLTAWGGIATVALHQTLASGERVYEIDDNNAADNPMRSLPVNLPVGTCCLSVRVKPGTATKTRIAVQNGSGSAAAVVTWSGGTPASVIPNGPNVGAVSCDPDPVNAGYYILRCTIVVATAGSFTVYLWPADWIPGGATTGTSYFGSPQIETGTVRTGYQAATSAYDVSEAGYSDVWFLRTNGINQWMSIAPFTSGSAGRTIVAAVRKNSDAAQGTLIEHRPVWLSALGGIALYAPSGSGGPATAGTYGSRYWNGIGASSGSQVNTAADYPAPHVAVVSAVNITGSHVLRVNGSVAGSQTHAGVIDQNTAGMTIGARDGSSLFGDLMIYGLLYIDRPLSAAELARTEQYMARLAGVTLA